MRPIALLLILLAGCVSPDVPPSPPTPVPVPSPAPSPQPMPGVIDFSRVASIMRADKVKSRKVGDGFAGLAFAISRAEIVGQPVKTTGELRNLVEEFERLSWQGTDLAGAFPGVSAEINAAMLAALGNDDRDLLPGEAASIVAALAEACR